METLTIENRRRSGESYFDFLQRNYQLSRTYQALEFLEINEGVPVDSVNGKIVNYLLDYQDISRITREYKDIYPQHICIPWSVFHRLIKDLNLWVDLLEYYTDAIPEFKLSEINDFRFEESSCIKEGDFSQILGIDNSFAYLVNFNRKIDQLKSYI